MSDESINATILRMAEKGLPPYTIAAALSKSTEQKITRNRVIHVIKRARAKGVDIPEFKRGRPPGVRAERRVGMQVMVPQRVVANLYSQASRRQMSPSALIVKIVATVIDDDMVGAVLDDDTADGGQA